MPVTPASTRILGGVAIGSVVAWLVLGAILPKGLPFGVVVLGLALEALTALGLVLVFRAARIVNFAQAEIGGLAAGVAVVAVAGAELPYLVAFFLALLVALVTGFLVDVIVVRRFFNASRLILTVATIGVAQVLGAGQIALPSLFDIQRNEGFTSPLDVHFRVGPVVFGGDHLTVILLVPVVLVGLAWFLSRSEVGIAIRAAADSRERALLLGIPVRRLSQVTWVVAAGLSGLGAILSVPILGTNLGGVAGPASLLGPLAAAVVARMERLGVAGAAALGIGVLRQVVFWNYPRATTVDVALFVVVLGALLLQRRATERVSTGGLGGEFGVAEVRPIHESLRRLPEVRVAKGALIALLAILAVGVPALLDNSRLVFMTHLGVFAVLATSLVVLTGWAGQISLGQFALAGVGGAVGAGLMSARGIDFFVALACAMAVSALAAVLVGIPALRIPGLFFAVTTLALAVPVATWLLNPVYFPVLAPDNLPRPVLFDRWSLDTSLRFYYVTLAGVAVAVYLAANFRRTRPGRVVLAVRDNERAAAALSVDPNRARLTAFGLSGALAGMAGLLYIVSLRAVPFNGFDATASIQLFTMVVIGGLGSLPGAILGAAYVWSAQFFLRGAVQLLATGAGLLVLLFFVPGGLGSLLFGLRDRALRRVASRHGLSVPSLSERAAFDIEAVDLKRPVETGTAVMAPEGSVDAQALLTVRDVAAAYGTAPVLFGVSFSVGADEIVALLGTNGAGKSTVLRVIGGLLPATAGAVRFDGEDIGGLDPTARVRRGLVIVPGGRGVFDSLTVEENLRVAAWTQRHDPAFVAQTRADIAELFPRLGERGNQRASSLSGGEQQMLTIAQAMLCRPKLLLIDELSLGLAPAVVGQLIEVVQGLVRRGVSVLVVEQSLNVAAVLADQAVFMERGQVRFRGRTASLLERDDLARSVFFGAALAARPDADALTVERGTGASLAVEHVTRSFGGVRALSDVTIGVEAGEILGIIGSNGAGKTTLFDHISGFLIPDEGTVAFGGVDVTRLDAAERAALGLGRLFQDARLFPALTVAETISVAFERHLPVRDPFLCALGTAAVRAAERRLRDDVGELIHTMGLERYEDAFISELSTGTRRVVELACAMAHRPSLLLLDEPSSGIAQRESEALAELLLRLRDRTGATFVIIEHDIPLVRSISDRLLCLHLGSVLAVGAPETVLEDPAVMRSYLGGSDVAMERSSGAI
jgi:ABC-type branched-subunit amino acid transport system ATPase component/ABC-type branched-subunit amino acid transport system permease subunit